MKIKANISLKGMKKQINRIIQFNDKFNYEIILRIYNCINEWQL